MVDALLTSMQNLPVLLTGQDFLHSCAHFLGLHLSGFMIAILSLSSPPACMLGVHLYFLALFLQLRSSVTNINDYHFQTARLF